ncbi:hypothetical protein [Pyrococcus yayanosii]|uniref:Uncharacterized protein n=1 Tax=Pyrococcus yayanosii (strain CH1 / JCM 16557) TaxID=529709 RepID=F8AJ78_PYRYC|nr:hypothetical protein [Pyrococcus yayanosii]AEH24519.1 hypothetical protein PYCH_08340 [Pyrococcus yayanosii CH1]
MRILEMIKYHMLIVLRDMRYLAGIIPCMFFAVYLKNKIIEDPTIFVLMGILVFLFSRSFDPKRIGMIFNYKPNTDAVALLTSIAINLPVILSFSYAYPGFLISNLTTFIALSSLPLSISPRIKGTAFVLGLLATAGRKATLIGYILLAIAFLLAHILKDKLVGVYLIKGNYISTISFEVRGVAIVLSIVYIIIAEYLKMQGVSFACGFWAFKAPATLALLSDPQRYESITKLASSMGGLCIGVSLIWPLFLVGDSYIDSHITYLHYLRPENYRRRLIKETTLFLTSLIVPLVFYSLAIFEKLFLKSLYRLVFILALSRLILSLTLPNFERNGFLWIYLLLISMPFFWPITQISIWTIPLVIALSPLAYIVRIKLEGVRKNA